MIHFAYMLETLKSSAVFCFSQFSYKTIQNKNYFTFWFIFTISGALYFHLVSLCCLKTFFCSVVIVILRLPWASISSTSSWYFFFPFVMSLILVVFFSMFLLLLSFQWSQSISGFFPSSGPPFPVTWCEAHGGQEAETCSLCLSRVSAPGSWESRFLILLFFSPHPEAANLGLASVVGLWDPVMSGFWPFLQR